MTVTGSDDAVSVSTCHHLSVEIYQHEWLLGYRLLDLRREYAPLLVELACRAVARHPERAGQAWRLALGLGDEQHLVVEARLGAEPRSLLEVLRVPLASFAWLARSTAATLEANGDFAFRLRVVPPSSALVNDWRERVLADEDFELVLDDEPGLVLPIGFHRGATAGPGRCLERAGACWLRAAFTRTAFEELEAAARDARLEQGWLLGGRVQLSAEAALVVVEELLPTPVAEAGPHHLLTLAGDFLEVYRKHDNIVGYAHLHPREVEGKTMGPEPSGADHTLAWNLQAALETPCCYPIALYGAAAQGSGAAPEVAVYGYDRGVLRRIGLTLLD